jgi:glutamate/tyrosine decarboxylase-like PLP-dependent enzyme
MIKPLQLAIDLRPGLDGILRLRRFWRLQMTSNLQQKMFLELMGHEIFETAKLCAYEYADGTASRRAYPTTAAISELERFVEELPEHTGDGAAIIRELHAYGSPATVASTGGRYFGLVNGGAIPAALGARWLADFWDQNSALFKTSPVSSKLEEACEGWLRDLFGLPPETVAGFVSGTSSAILCGLAAGRHRVFQNQGWDINTKGFRNAPRIRVVTGRHAHGTVVKAVAVLGIGIENIEWVDVDDQGRIIPDRVPELDDTTILILQAGNVNSGSFDAFEVLCGRANAAGAWVHIDGAFGLWAAGCAALSHLTRGIEAAHSWSVDGHKTLNTPYDSGIVLCRDKASLIAALQASGSYIVYSDNRDGMLYTPEMSRRARATELWATLKYLGKRGIDELVSGLHARAVQIADALRAEGFEIHNDVSFNQVLVACENDAITEETIRHVQEAGECWVGGAKWRGRSVVRISVCSWATTSDDVSRSVRAFVGARQKAR